MSREGLLIVVCGPSGVGKGTLLSKILNEDKKIMFSVSATTREPRQGENEGIDYFFKTKVQFEDMIKNDDLLEWVKYCDNYYGTPKAFIDSSISDGNDVILDIEVEGAMRVKEKYPECILVFVVPPTIEELKKRIEKRGSESSISVSKRLKRAEEELNYIDKYDYVIVNDDVNEAINELKSIIVAEKLKISRNHETINIIISDVNS